MTMTVRISTWGVWEWTVHISVIMAFYVIADAEGSGWRNRRIWLTGIRTLNVRGEAVLKLALIEDYRPAVLGSGGLVEFGASVPRVMELPGHLRMTALIEQWSEYRDLVAEAASGTNGVARARLRAPVPRPGKLLC